MRARDELLAAIVREQALIGRLEREREDAQARIQSLQAHLGAPAKDAACSISPHGSAIDLQAVRIEPNYAGFSTARTVKGPVDSLRTLSFAMRWCRPSLPAQR